jgi:scyllo-inositol 2-dehydrogenase (NADP+)
LPTPIQVGLIGFGFAGQTFHAPIIAGVEGLELAAILQRNGDTAAQAYPQARVVRSLREMLSLDSISLIVVATPNDSHAPIAKESLLAGRDVVIDKPFALTYAEAGEVAKLAEKQGRLLSVYQNRRFDGDFNTLQKLIAAGDLGRIVTYESHFDRFRPELRAGAWREQAGPGTGVLFDLGPHLIDQALTLFGAPKLSAQMSASSATEPPPTTLSISPCIIQAYGPISAPPCWPVAPVLITSSTALAAPTLSSD